MTKLMTIDGPFEIPPITSLADFRRWAWSDEFPECGRIDYVCGAMSIDLEPEELISEGLVKAEVAAGLLCRVKQRERGLVFINRGRISSPIADLSTEPDIMFVSYNSLIDCRCIRVPKPGQPGHYIEMEGAPDLIVEIVRDRSVERDTAVLPKAYYRAGLSEYWLIDARHADLSFQVHRRGSNSFESVAPVGDGFQYSAVMDCMYRLERGHDPIGFWKYDLQAREAN